MSKQQRVKSKKSVESSISVSFISLVNLYIDKFYPYSFRLNYQELSQFGLYALAYTANAIFIPCKASNSQNLMDRIKADLAKLKKKAQPSANLFYFLETDIKHTGKDYQVLAKELSIDGFPISILDQKGITEVFISSGVVKPEMDKDTLEEYYKILYNSEKDDTSVLGEIFTYYKTVTKKEIRTEPIDNRLVSLKEKIKLNFPGHYYLTIVNTYNSHRGYRAVTEYFIKQNFYKYKDELELILDRIMVKVCTADFNTDGSPYHPINEPVFFDELTDMIIPPEKRGGIKYRGICKAIVLFFFEYCEFGEKTLNEPPTLFKFYEIEDDNTK